MNPNTNKSQFIILGNTGSHIPCPDVTVLSNFAPEIKTKFKEFIGEIKKNHWSQLIFHQEDKQKKSRSSSRSLPLPIILFKKDKGSTKHVVISG